MKSLLALAPLFTLAALVVIGKGCGNQCERWTTPLDRDDMRSCNAARAGTTDLGEYRYELCMKSMGYKLEQVECSK